MSARGITAWYWAGTATCAVAVLALPPLPGLLPWSVLGVLAAAAVVTGVMRHRPRTLWPWGLLAAGILVSTGADAAYTFVEVGAPRSLLVVANLLYLLMFICAVTALLRLARSGSANAEQTGLVDALTITLVLVLLVWVCVVSPSVPGLEILGDPILLAYLIGDALLLATVMRLLTSRRRTPAVGLLLTGALGALVADVVNSLDSVTNSALTSSVTNIGWLLLYAAWGAAALHPSMARLTEPEVLPDREINARHLAVLMGGAVAPPLILVAEAIAGEVRDALLLGVASATMFLVSLARVAALANTHRRSLVYREHHDTLTGLANRALFSAQLSTEVARPGSAPAVLLVDLDDFKLVNDTMGHSVGDEVLVTVARRIARSLGRHDLGARLGGDEFAILVASATTGDVEALAARVAAALAEPVVFGAREVHVTTSIGVAVTRPEADAPVDDGLLSRAGLALQAARAEGPGRWCRYDDEVHGPMVDRRRRRTELAVAVAEGSFTLQFQPIVALVNNVTIGFEALVRWKHPTLGHVAPSEFIELAEETGLIEPIGDWVLRRAVAAAAHWHRTDPPGPYVSVNVSARQFRTPGFAERVHRVLAAAGLPASQLMVELTESVLLREEDEVWAELAALSDAGVRLAIDDFGTGFSSMTYLLQTPFDVIKIDKSFVSTLSVSPRHRAIVELIVHLAQRLSLHVVAEGIETSADRDLLAQIGCPYGQGYLYSVPLTSSEANRWLAADASSGEGVRQVPSPGDGEYAHSSVTAAPPGTLPP